ncbi:hypothetical protein XcvCFBP7113P_13090 [Xanthomonas citri pv. vignicola]|nr:hypothetical protein XcvCFBP7113P_13090 [Xanthomonas citri pv. vignicola]
MAPFSCSRRAEAALELMEGAVAAPAVRRTRLNCQPRGAVAAMRGLPGLACVPTPRRMAHVWSGDSA